MSEEPDDLFAAPPLPIATLDDAQRLACLRLIRSENVGPATFRALINHFGGAQAALEALPEVGRRAGRGRALRICSKAQAAAEIDAVRRAGAHIVFTIEPGYPAPLAFLDGAPPMLYIKGRPELLSRHVISIVGSRQSSAAGMQIARQFAAAFGAAGFVVASGLARGVDAAAHQAALGTATIGVIAGGIDVVYPREHAVLQAEIGTRGCLIAEQPLGFQPRAQDFPRRNRIISGIARAVVVIEAARRSGSLITARLAAEQGREVFAVPGHPLDARAEGTNQLIKDGALMATTAEDVIGALQEQLARPRVPPSRQSSPSRQGNTSSRFATGGLEEVLAPAPMPPSRPLASGDGATTTVLEQVEATLGAAPVAIDSIIRATGLAPGLVQVAVMELALAGRIEMHGHQLVSLLQPA